MKFITRILAVLFVFTIPMTANAQRSGWHYTGGANDSYATAENWGETSNERMTLGCNPKGSFVKLKLNFYTTSATPFEGYVKDNTYKFSMQLDDLPPTQTEWLMLTKHDPSLTSFVLNVRGDDARKSEIVKNLHNHELLTIKPLSEQTVVYKFPLEKSRFGNKSPVLRVFKDCRDTRLHKAAEKNVAGYLRKQLEAGADVNAKDPSDQTPLHYAAFSSADKSIVLLLQHGANVNAQEIYGSTPLHVAAHQRTGKTAALLLQHGADVNAQNAKGNTPLHIAAWKKADKAAALLLQHGADVNAKNMGGNTPLHFAANYSATVAALLLQNGANADVKNKKNYSPWDIAIDSGGKILQAFEDPDSISPSGTVKSVTLPVVTP